MNARRIDIEHARSRVRNALVSGKLTKKPCSVCCVVEKTEANHEDYSNPLAVIWLCSVHHRERHVEIRKKQKQQNIYLTCNSGNFARNESICSECKRLFCLVGRIGNG